MPRYSLKNFQSAAKSRPTNHTALDFSSLGSECASIYNSFSKIKDPLEKIMSARAAVKETVLAFNNDTFGTDTAYAVKVLDSILSSIHQMKLSTKDGNDYSFSRAQADLDKLDPTKMSPAEYLIARNGLGSLIDPVAMYKQYALASDHNRGIHEFITCEERGFLKPQASGIGKYYCKLVPLYMQPFKLRGYYDTSGSKVNVPYMHWSPEYLFGIMPVSLYVGMYCVYDRPSDEDIMEARASAMVVKSGKTEGTVRNPASYYGFSGKDHALKHHETLSRIMLGQTWASHPSNRTAGMVLDPYDWDLIPTPLISGEVFKTEEVSNKLGITINDNLPF